MINRQYDWRAVALAVGFVVGVAAPQRLVAAGDAAGEFAVKGGGISLSDGGGSHPMVGADISAKVSDHLRLFGEFSYVPLGSSSFSGTFLDVRVSSRASAKAYLFGGGLRYFFTSNAKATPFVEIAAGNARGSVSGSGNAAGVNLSTSYSSNSLYYGGGVGLRYAVSERWGLRPEIRYLKFNGGGGGFAYGAGLFFQFGK